MTGVRREPFVTLPTMRGVRLLSFAGALAVGTFSGAPAASATTPPTTPTESTTPATTVASTAPGATVANDAPAGPIIAPVGRAGSAMGGFDRHRGDDDWDLGRIALATALTLGALAAAGYVYGRVQSLEPRVGRTVRPAE